jgi:hypothetical protein
MLAPESERRRENKILTDTLKELVRIFERAKSDVKFDLEGGRSGFGTELITILLKRTERRIEQLERSNRKSDQSR